MKTATTLEFRNAVKKYAAKKGLRLGDSWTNKTTASAGSNSDHRTVGIFAPSATPLDAVKIEKKLNKKGLTAQTRVTESDDRSYSYRDSWGSYIRGTCVLE